MATDVAKLHSAALRDALREAVRTAHRRKINEAERDLFLSFVDELEVRAKRDAKRIPRCSGHTESGFRCASGAGHAGAHSHPNDPRAGNSQPGSGAE